MQCSAVQCCCSVAWTLSLSLEPTVHGSGRIATCHGCSVSNIYFFLFRYRPAQSVPSPVFLLSGSMFGHKSFTLFARAARTVVRRVPSSSRPSPAWLSAGTAALACGAATVAWVSHAPGTYGTSCQRHFREARCCC